MVRAGSTRGNGPGARQVGFGRYDTRVRRLALRILTAIQLTRLTMAFGAVSDIWFVILFTRGVGQYDVLRMPVTQLPMATALLAGGVAAVGLFAYGASLNDILDVRHDAAFSPDRPIPAGRIRVSQAIVVTVGALIVAVLGGAWLGLGAACLTLLAAAGVLFYNAAGKYIPAVGAVTIGLVHAAHMLIPNHQLTFTLPVWLVMMHSMIIAAVVHIQEDKRPRLSRRTWVAIVLGGVVWSVVIIGAGALHEPGIWPTGVSLWGLVYPALAVFGFLCIAWWKVSVVSGRSAAEKLKRYGAMWQCLYGASWLLAVGLLQQAIWLGILAVAGFAGMTLIKELTGLSGRPLVYRG